MRNRVKRLESLLKEQLRQRSRDIPSVADELATQALDQERDGMAIIHIPRSQAAGKQLSLITGGEMQFEAKESAHGGLAAGSLSSEDAVLADPFGMTDR